MPEAEEKKRLTTHVSDGSDWVEINSDAEEISRTPKKRLPTGHYLEPLGVYGGELSREISEVPAGTEVGIMTVPGGKLIILHRGTQISIDATEGDDFEYQIPINVIEKAPQDDTPDLYDAMRDAAADLLKQREEFEDSIEEVAIKGVDMIAEMIEAERIKFGPDAAQVEVYSDEKNHASDGIVVVYDDSKILNLDREKIAKMVISGKMPGFIVKPEQIVDLVFLALQTHSVLMNENANMPTRLRIASDLHDILFDLRVI